MGCDTVGHANERTMLNMGGIADANAACNKAVALNNSIMGEDGASHKVLRS